MACCCYSLDGEDRRDPALPDFSAGVYLPGTSVVNATAQTTTTTETHISEEHWNSAETLPAPSLVSPGKPLLMPPPAGVLDYVVTRKGLPAVLLGLLGEDPRGVLQDLPQLRRQLDGRADNLPLLRFDRDDFVHLDATSRERRVTTHVYSCHATNFLSARFTVLDFACFKVHCQQWERGETKGLRK